MIFKKTMSLLNPVMTIGKQMIEPLIQHKKLCKIEAFDITIRLIKKMIAC